MGRFELTLADFGNRWHPVGVGSFIWLQYLSLQDKTFKCMPTFLRSGIRQWLVSRHVAADSYGINPTIALHGYVSLGNMRTLSVPQFSHLKNGKNSSSQLCGGGFGN